VGVGVAAWFLLPAIKGALMPAAAAAGVAGAGVAGAGVAGAGVAGTASVGAVYGYGDDDESSW
jgi:hypothetical protein